MLTTISTTPLTHKQQHGYEMPTGWLQKQEQLPPDKKKKKKPKSQYGQFISKMIIFIIIIFS